MLMIFDLLLIMLPCYIMLHNVKNFLSNIIEMKDMAKFLSINLYLLKSYHNYSISNIGKIHTFQS